LARYVDGFVVPVPTKNLKAYRRMAQLAGKICENMARWSTLAPCPVSQNSHALRPMTKGRTAFSTALLSIDSRPSSR
jgi:hypothetical protein